MKTSLSYLPQIKQQQILLVADIIREVANPEKIILFGSYATGDYVEDNYIEKGIKYEYISDYDFLVVTRNAIEKDYVIQDTIINRCRNLFSTPVTPIIHEIEYVNEGLEIGQYFFTDIINEGVLLFDSDSVNFSIPRELTPAERKEIALRYFEQWFETGNEFLIDAKNAYDRNSFKQSAFYLHQSVERFYNTALLVFTAYKPKTHNLDKLRHYAKPLSKRLFGIFPFPVNDKNENHLFDLLKRGYIDARYKNDYKISHLEVKLLIERIQDMKSVVELICKEKLQLFESN